MKKKEFTREEVGFLVDRFYERVREDDLIGPKFSHVNFEKHLPKMTNFWSTVIFSDGTYSGSPFDKHISLGLSKEHFERWLLMFEDTVRNYYEGEMAEQIIQRANVIGLTFQYKLKSLSTE